MGHTRGTDCSAANRDCVAWLPQDYLGGIPAGGDGQENRNARSAVPGASFSSWQDRKEEVIDYFLAFLATFFLAFLAGFFATFLAFILATRRPPN